MVKYRAYKPSKILVYETAWLLYIVFAFFAFPIFSLPTMLMSIALTMLSAWLYGFVGCAVTTLLSIPFHYIILAYYTDTPALWKETLNPFGISTQFSVSCAVAMLRHTKLKIEDINKLLEIKVEDRTKELNHLQHYIVQNQESAQVLLSHMVLGDIGDSLMAMRCKSDVLVNALVFEENATSTSAIKLNEMIKKSIDIVQHLEFVDHFFSDQTTGFMSAVSEVADHFSHTAGVHFDLEIYEDHASTPRYIQHQLYRITQEAITNAVRHGKAENISVQLQIGEGCYRLSVINDGNPLPPKVESGLGLKLMQHRTQQLDGSLSWQTTEDGWTKLDCSIPQRPD